MINKLLTITAMSLTLLLMACPQEGIVPPNTDCIDIDIVNIIGNSNGGRSFTVQDVTVEAQTLKIETSYNCGCGDSNFLLQATAAFKESLPVQTDISLLLKGNDNCEALCQATLCFDITPLIDEYKATYPGTGGTLNINLDDYDSVISVDI